MTEKCCTTCKHYTRSIMIRIDLRGGGTRFGGYAEAEEYPGAPTLMVCSVNLNDQRLVEDANDCGADCILYDAK